MEGDSWSNWEPDPQRAFSEHDPALEPYASMSREEILEAMRNARGGHEWEFLREFLLDKCSESELCREAFAQTLRELESSGWGDLCDLNELAGPPTRLISKHCISPTQSLE